MLPHSLLLHSRSFRPLRNTFRSIDFAVDTQAVGTERRRSRKSARVKGGETGMRSAKGGGGRRRTYRSERGKKRNAAAETRSRNKRVARVERGTGQKGEREGGKEKGRDRQKPRTGKGRKRTDGREEETEMLETGSARDREETRETAFNYPPIYGGEERLVCSGLHHPPPRANSRPPTASLFPAFLPPSPSLPFSSSCLPSPSFPSLPHIKHTSPAPPSVVFLSSSATGKQIHPEGDGESHPAVVLARAAL